MRRHPLSYVKLIFLAAFVYLLWNYLTSLTNRDDFDDKDTLDFDKWQRKQKDTGIDAEENKLADDLLPPPDPNNHEPIKQQPLEMPDVAPPDDDRNRVDENGLKDWTDYVRLAEEAKRAGPGEHGAAVLTEPHEEKDKEELYKVNGFNGYVSDKISLDRAIPDFRVQECKPIKYPSRLLNASVVIPFHNEHWTTLLRSVHSLINRTPPELLHEIVLADDFSHKPFLGKQLDDYLKEHFGTKVRVVHADKREGLIRARLMAAKQATGDVIIVLDSHIEANTNWLPPLIAPITEDYRTVTCPCIDIIDYDDFSLRPDHGGPGVFDWELHFKTLARPEDSTKHPANNYKSPVMVGGLFAISRKWFWELGGYDPGLDIWGGEQYELSFKLWQCGGTMYNVPCSRVAHIYRKFAPFPNPGVGDFIARNYRRVADVWMDDYAKYMYMRQPHYKNVDPGDLTEQLAVRERLKCKPFKWFMEEVAYELLKHFPYIEPSNHAEGEIRNVDANLCIDVKFKGQGNTFGLETCTQDKPSVGGEQNLAISWRGDLRPKVRDVCFDVPVHEHKAKIILYVCHNMRGNQQFNYNLETKQIYHPNSRMCIDCDKAQKEIFMEPCDDTKLSQQWNIQTVNATLVEEAWKNRHKQF